MATLANRSEVNVAVDGHVLVTRHLAILAMTGAGKSWTSRRLIEQLALKDYPIVIFDPRGDYTGLVDVPSLKGRVNRYYAEFPLFDEDADTVGGVVGALAYPLTETMRTRFGDLFGASVAFLSGTTEEVAERTSWLQQNVSDAHRLRFGVKRDLWLVALLADTAHLALRKQNMATLRQLQDWGWSDLTNYNKSDAKTLEGIRNRCRRAAAVMSRMEQTNRKISKSADPLPLDRTKLVSHGKISVVSLAGYTGDFQATIYSLVAETIFSARVSNELRYPALLILEEAHNFAPPKATTSAEEQSIRITKQIAQEGRKFGVGLVLISQRPSRLDETTLSQCNSYIIMRLMNPSDQNYVRRVIESIGEDEARMLPDLDVGEAILAGQFINFPVLAKIKAPESQGEREEDDAFAELSRAHAEAVRLKRR